jgi:hypothetical protein
MKRLALLVAAAASLAGMGCGSSPPPCIRSVTVDWSGGFLASNGQRLTCAQAGVSEVDLYINGDPKSLARVSCASLGAQAVDLPGGSATITVEGVEPSGRIAFRDEPTVNTTCGDVHVVAVPGEGELVLDYSFTPLNVCYATQPTYIWSEVWDNLANEAAFVDASTRGASPVCSTTAAAPTFRLPVGSYTLMGVNEWSPNVGSTGIVGADCSRPTFPIAAGAQTTVKPLIADSTQACF